MENYQEKKQARIDRYRELAEKSRTESTDTFNQSHKLASAIPFGQPILVGHHSEKSDRRYRDRIGRLMDKSVKADKKATYYDNKADSAERNRVISSDDPEAVQKLKAKIEQAEKLQDVMKRANRIIKGKPSNAVTDDKIQRLAVLPGFDELKAHKLFEPDFCGRVGFASYALTNNNANIRRMKQRLIDLAEAQTAEHKETKYEGFTIVENAEENRIQILFDSKDLYFSLCKDRGINLRSYGFVYSKYSGAWQRQLNNSGRWAVERVVKAIQG